MKSANESAKHPNNSSPDGDLSVAVAACRSESFVAALGELYSCVDDELSAVGAVCKGGGSCCKFDLAGHRLFVSAGELALLSAEAPPNPHRALLRRCPWQTGPLCTAHTRRPLGCRTYFCDRPTTDACQAIYERYHNAISQLHEAHSLEYRYVELTCACVELLHLRDENIDE